KSKKDFNTFMCSEHGKQWMQDHVRELWFPLAPEGKAHMKLVRAVRSIYPEYSFPADWKIAMHNPELLLHVQPEAFDWLRGPEGQETLKRHRNKLWIEERERYAKIKQWMLKNFSEEILKDLLPTFREIFDVVTPEKLMGLDPVEIDHLLKSKEGHAWIIDNRHTIWDAQTVRQNGPLTELQKTLLCLYPIQEDENEKIYPQTLRTSDSWKRDGIERVNLMIFCQQGFSRFHPKATIDEVGEKILTLYSLGIKVAEIRIAYFHEETADGGGPLRSYFSEALYALSQRQKSLKDFGCPTIEGTFDSQFFVKLGATLGCLYDLKIPTGSLFSPDVYRSFFIPLEGSKIRLNAKSLSEISSFRKLLGADDGGVMAPKLFDILSLIAKWEVIDESDPSWSSCRVNYLTQYSEVKGDLDVVIETELVPQMNEESLKFCGDSFSQSQAAVKALRSYYITVLRCLLKIPEKFEAISHLHSGISLLVEMPSDPLQFMQRMQGTCSSEEILKVLNFKTTPRDLTQKIECWLEENAHHPIALETFLYNLTGSRTLPIEMVKGAERELLITVFSPVCDDFGTVLSDQKIHTCSRWMETPYPSTLPATLSLTQQCQNKLQDFLDLCYRGVLLDHNAY
ncbi:MAG: hypothetical protein KDK40_05335, partial [Chlamydiia bacterium]|nr:hypothetical protein [Chlamydiia bacterium]